MKPTRREEIRYMGQVIRRCGQYGIGDCNGKGWHIRTYHYPSGIQWAEEEQPKFSSLQAAKEAIRLPY
jgi:hypothetical protein